MGALARVTDASETRLIALQALEIHPAGAGACVCGAGVGYVACTCAWGVMIDRLLAMGYTAPQETIATQIQQTSAFAEERMRIARVRAIRSVARQWGSSLAAFCRMLGLTPARLDALVPGIREVVRSSRS